VKEEEGRVVAMAEVGTVVDRVVVERVVVARVVVVMVVVRVVVVLVVETVAAEMVAEMVAEVMVALMVEYAVETSVGLEQAGESLAMATEEAAKAAPVPPEARRGGSMTLLS